MRGKVSSPTGVGQEDRRGQQSQAENNEERKNREGLNEKPHPRRWNERAHDHSIDGQIHGYREHVPCQRDPQ